VPRVIIGPCFHERHSRLFSLSVTIPSIIYITMAEAKKKQLVYNM
jgi:hypothetical protein